MEQTERKKKRMQKQRKIRNIKKGRWKEKRKMGR
jgi:hypothetical protein